MLKALIESEIRRMLTGETPQEVNATAPIDFGSSHKIVIAQRGFVFAGDVSVDGDYIVISNAVNVRKWGTTRGLGELAANGNKSETKADPAGTVRLHQLSVVAMLDCEEPIHATA